MPGVQESALHFWPMKRRQLLRHLREQHCVPHEKGRGSTMYRNEVNGSVASVPSDPEPHDAMIRMICRLLDIDVPKSIFSEPARSSSARGVRRAAKRTPRG